MGYLWPSPASCSFRLSSSFLHPHSAAIPVSRPVEQRHWGIKLPEGQKFTGHDVSIMTIPLSTRHPFCPRALSVWYHNGTWGQWDSGSGSVPDIWASSCAHRKLIITFEPLADWQGHLSPYKERNECLNARRWQRSGTTWLSVKAWH